MTVTRPFTTRCVWKSLVHIKSDFIFSLDTIRYTLQHFRREHPSLDQMRPDSKATFPVEFALPPCGYKSTTMSPKVAAKALKSVVEHRPLKKRPVDESSLKLSARSTTSLPEPKLIRVVKPFPPTTFLATCSYDDIERQGRLNRNKLKCPTSQQQTSNHKRELLLQKLLKWQLLREERKAKQHFHQHYNPNNAARQSLLQRLQQELYEQAQHRSVSPSQCHPNLVRDLLHACNSSSVSSSMVLSNEQPLYSGNPSDPPHYHLFQKLGRSGGTGRVVYDYAHAA